jgi:hypothetical protein
MIDLKDPEFCLEDLGLRSKCGSASESGALVLCLSENMQTEAFTVPMNGL